MAIRTYKISKGQQYDKEGALVSWNGQYAHYTRASRYQAGDFPRLSDQDALETLVREVIATGEARTLTVGQAAPVVQWAKAAMQRPACPAYVVDQGCPLHGEICAEWGR